MQYFCLLLLWLADPRAFDQKLREGLLALEQSKLPQAQAKLQEAAALNPKDPVPWLGLARVHQRFGHSQQAKGAAQKAESLGPRNATVLRTLIQFYIDAKQWSAAAERSARLAEVLPNDTGVQAQRHYLLAQSYLAERQPGPAEEAFRKANTLDPGSETAAFQLSQLLLRRGNFAEAVTVLERAREKTPSSAQLQLALGVAYYGQRRFDDAVTAFLRTIQLAPAVEQPYIFLGRMLDKLGDRLPRFHSAVVRWSRANPRDYRGALVEAKVLQLMNAEPSRVEPLLRAAVARNKANWEPHFELGVFLSKRRAWAESAQQLEKAAALNPQEPSPQYHLARVYDRLREPEKAAAARKTHQQLTAAERARNKVGMGSPEAPEEE